MFPRKRDMGLMTADYESPQARIETYRAYMIGLYSKDVLAEIGFTKPLPLSPSLSMSSAAVDGPSDGETASSREGNT